MAFLVEGIPADLRREVPETENDIVVSEKSYKYRSKTYAFVTCVQDEDKPSADPCPDRLRRLFAGKEMLSPEDIDTSELC
jgi:hypothetical protein